MVPITNEYASGMTDERLDTTINTLTDDYLKPEQVAFAEFFSTGMSSEDAAKAAGYKTAGPLLKNDRVIDLVVLLRERMSRASNTTRAWRKTALREIHDKAVNSENYSAGIAAIRELNSMDHEEKVRMTVEHGINQMIAKLSIPVEQEFNLIAKVFHIMQWSENELIDAL